MPANLVHCQVCRTLLNDSLEIDTLDAPEFVPLQEIEAVVDAEPGGFFVSCPTCEKELRINRKYVGVRVQCKFCQTPFVFSRHDPKVQVVAAYFECPHCSQEIRANVKYLGTKVACKFCKGHIQLVDSVPQDSR